MSERKAPNKWYPPDWEPKHGSVNKYQGSHPLRERAKKLDQGILVIRIEMPFNAWCLGCNNHIGMGVRYNAEKTKVGMYHSTPILQFKLKCHLCDNIMILQTDPENRDYIFISGGKRKEQRWDPEDNEQIGAMDRDTHFRLESDAMYRLEHEANDVAKLTASQPVFSEAVALQNERDRDDCEVNRALRVHYREMRKAASETTANGGIKLLPGLDADRTQASLIRAFATKSSKRKQNSFSRALAMVRKKKAVSKPLSSTKSLHLLSAPIGLVRKSDKLSPEETPSTSSAHPSLVADYGSSDEQD